MPLAGPQHRNVDFERHGSSEAAARLSALGADQTASRPKIAASQPGFQAVPDYPKARQSTGPEGPFASELFAAATDSPDGLGEGRAQVCALMTRTTGIEHAPFYDVPDELNRHFLEEH